MLISMDDIKNIIEFVFGSALFINALLFVPQIIRIFKEKTSQGVSLLTFGGFLLIQLTVILHGAIHQDYILVGGYLLSMLTCGAVVFLAILYRKNNNSIERVDLEEILDQLPGHVYWKDRDGVTLGCNKNNWSDFGAKSADDFIGKNDYELFNKHQADVLRKHDLEVMSSGENVVCEEKWTNENGKTIVYLSHKSPLNNKKGDVIGIIGTSVDITESKRETLENLKMLENIVAIMPGHVYWMDKEGTYLGCNDNQAKSIGFDSREEIIGKRNKEISDFAVPEVLDEVNKKVLESGKTITAEEPAILNDGGCGTFLSTKTPLYNHDHEIIGMVGVSIDITDRKKAEESERQSVFLRLETELQKAKLMEYDRSKKIAYQAVHDIRSPLASLLMLVKSYEDDIPEKTRIALRDATMNIGDIANNLLNKYKQDESDFGSANDSFSTIVALSLLRISGEKRHQYKELPVKFSYHFCDYCSFVFVAVGSTDFRRMISNIIDNAVEALPDSGGRVDVTLEKSSSNVSIAIEDTGKGMPHDVIDKIMSGIDFTSGKRGGHGLGFSLIRKVINACDGRLAIESQLGKGTKIILTIPRCATPGWISKEIILHKGDTVVVLDDDDSIHSAWESRFKQYQDDVQLKHFRLGKEAETFINEFSDKSKIFLLSDFELLKQEMTGLHIIERTKIKRSVLVTSHYSNLAIRDLAKKSYTKILPKALASDVNIKLMK